MTLTDTVAFFPVIHQKPISTPDLLVLVKNVYMMLNKGHSLRVSQLNTQTLGPPS